VVPGIEHRIVDPFGKPVEPGEAGELQIKGPIVMKGYWNDPGKTEAAFQEGWFRTGDIMRMGKLRVLEFVDREKDVIKCGGYSVFPTEIEHHLADHPKVDRAVVVAVPHAIKGEMPVAVVKLKEGKEATAEEFESWADERIAAYKRPRAYLFTDSIPMTFSLKPLRKDLRQWAGEVLGADWGER
jgi:acyl-CoA synthetase (AMP-forming)/AMP-acid ligase II